MKRVAALALLVAASSLLHAQAPAPGSIKSHQVNPDGSVTFRYYGPGAKSVAVALETDAKPMPMARGENGVWSLTTAPLQPEYYSYNLVVDGLTQLDPLNSENNFNYQLLVSQVMVPGRPASPWELTGIPHGRVDHIHYTTLVEKDMPSGQSAYVVYTPPGYDEHRKGGYPVLYLLHGWSQTENSWTNLGHAQYILDTLIHEGRAVPMIVVMPLAYGDLSFTTGTIAVWTDPAKVRQNLQLFGRALFTEVMPAVDRDYNTAPGRENRAIAGLSMGGQESLLLGLTHTDQFAYIGGMSAAIQGVDFNSALPALALPGAAKKAGLRLLWVACGTEDRLIAPNRAFVAWAKSRGLNPVAVETPGLHVWTVWRENLLHLAPLLFQPATE